MILVLNFKTYFTKSIEYLNFINKLKKVKTKENKFWLSINPYFYLKILPLVKKNKNSQLKIGLQNMGFVSLKPQTGEIIYDFELVNKIDFVLIGHSERYRLGENLEIIKEKIKTLQNKNFNLVIFFSENSYLPQNNFVRVEEQINIKIKEIIKVIKKENYKKIYLVYEPWWAISTERGKIPSVKFLSDFLRWYKNRFNFPIFYGGSYNSTLKSFYSDLHFDGYVLGKAATDIQEIKKIISAPI